MIKNNMVLRLYLVNTIKGTKTGKKRDYPSLEHFYKYGKETYKRYDRREYFTGEPSGLKAELRFLNEFSKWQLFEEDDLKTILEKLYEKR